MNKAIQVITKGCSKVKLMVFLSKKPRRRGFCKHRWIYWKLNGSNAYHRVCKKCYIKQRYSEEDITKRGFWLKDVLG